MVQNQSDIWGQQGNTNRKRRHVVLAHLCLGLIVHGCNRIMAKVPQLAKDWGSRSTYNYALPARAVADVIGMCVSWHLALVFGLLGKLVSTPNSPSCSYSTQYERCQYKPQGNTQSTVLLFPNFIMLQMLRIIFNFILFTLYNNWSLKVSSGAVNKMFTHPSETVPSQTLVKSVLNHLGIAPWD